MNLNLKDKKILKELFNNARLPFSKIAKKVKLSKEVVNYRIKRLIENGFIDVFNTVIDIKKLGWQTFFVFVRLRNLDFEEEKTIINDLKKHKNIAWIVKCIGNYDLVLKIIVKDNEEINKVTKNLEYKYSKYFDFYLINYISEEHAVPFSFIYETNEKKTYSIKKTMQKQYTPSKIDLKLLKEIVKHARMPLSEISTKLNIPSQILKYHLKKLEREKVILKYRPSIWPDKIGYNWYFIILKIGKIITPQSNQLNTYLLNQKNVTYFYKIIGENDIGIEIRVKTTKELSKILLELRTILKKTLKRHEIMIILEEPLFTCFPECIIEDN